MIAERLPELAAMSQEEKWLVYRELEEELHADVDSRTGDPEAAAAFSKMLEARMEHYHANPESALTLEQLGQRMSTWKSKSRSQDE